MMRFFQTGLTVLLLAISAATALSIDHRTHKMLLARQTNSTSNPKNTTLSQTRYVFAHFMVGIVSNRNSSADWDNDMIRAKAYGIDAFALNIGTDYYTDTQLQYAYASAASNGMKVFLSFDFNWWSTGAASAVGQKAAQYGKLPAQLMVDGKIFVSTFVGDGVDVNAIRSAAGSPIYFAPNFHPTYGVDFSQSDGGFNWMGWPNDGNNRAPSTGQTGTLEAGDQIYLKSLGSKDYIAPVSPWFFTHYGSEVSYSKNWLFPGDLLWYTRWQQLLTMGPRFVEIISWNDYGESHYIGPLSSIHTDDGASKWCNDMPHNGWLDMAKPFIAAYKAGATAVDNYITSDQLIYWYRPQLKTTNCDATDTCMQPLGNPDYYIGRPNGWQTVSDSVFVVSLLKSAGTLQVSSGNNSQSFSAPAGANSYIVPMSPGKQKFSLVRSSQAVLSGTSLKDISSGCVCGLYNFNAYVGSIPPAIDDALQGFGLSNFATGLKVATCAATPSLGSETTSSTAFANSTTQSSTLTSTTTGALSSATTTTPSSTTASTTPTTISTTTKSTTPSTTPSTTAMTSTSSSFSSSSISSSSRSLTTSTMPSSIGNTSRSSSSSTTLSLTSTTKITTTPSTTSKASTTLSTSSTKTTTSSTTTTSASCNNGNGSGNYAGLCSFCCSFGYCPPGPCTCSQYGTPGTPPPSNGRSGAPQYGLDDSYRGLCDYSCNHGYCPDGACRYV